MLSSLILASVVTFLGDSITHGGGFAAYVQLFECLRNPGSEVRYINSGESGGNAGGGWRRASWDVLPDKPEKVYIMFGMNDVNRGAYKEVEPTDEKNATSRKNSLNWHEKNMRGLVDFLLTNSVEVVLMTPTPFDQYSSLQKAANYKGCNDPGLKAVAELARNLAKEKKLGVVENYEPLTELLEANTNYLFLSDRVHPNVDGHMLIAANILDQMKATPEVATVAFTKKAKRPLFRNAEVSDVKLTRNALEFTYAPKSLPLPITKGYLEMEKFCPFTEKFNQERLLVDMLEKGVYEIAFDGERVGEFTSEELAKGVNIARLDTPNQKKAKAAFDVAMKLRGKASRWRNYPLVVLKLKDDKINPDDYAAADAHLADWLKKNENSQYFKSFKHWVDSYHELRDQKESVLKEIDDLYKELQAVRPSVSKVTIKRVRGE